MTNPPSNTPRARWDQRLFRVEAALVSTLLAVMLVLVLLQVTARSLLEQPLPWSDEASRLCLVWLTFVGAGALMAHGQHLAVDALMRVLPRRAGMAVEVISNVVVATACGCVLATGIGFVAVVAQSVTPALAISTGWFYGAGLTGMVLVIVHAVVNSIDALRAGAPRYATVAEDVVEDAIALETVSAPSGGDADHRTEDGHHAGVAPARSGGPKGTEAR